MSAATSPQFVFLPGKYKSVYKRESRTKHTGDVIDIGPITIERIISASGKEGYRVIGRERKIMTTKQLATLRAKLDRELRRDYKLQCCRSWWETNKEQYNAKRRLRYAELKALR